MPIALLDSQFATLEEPTLDEHPIIVDVDGKPAEIAHEIVRRSRSGSTRPTGLRRPPRSARARTDDRNTRRVHIPGMRWGIGVLLGAEVPTNISTGSTFPPGDRTTRPKNCE